MPDVSVFDPSELTPEEISVQIPKEAPGQPGKTQLAYQNNNPGNIRYVGQPNAKLGAGGMAAYPDPQTGYQDVLNTVRKHAAKGDTLESYIRTYAPPNENDTDGYIKNASKALGVDRTARLSAMDHEKVAQFQIGQESSARALKVQAFDPNDLQAFDANDLSAEAPAAKEPPVMIPGYGPAPGVKRPLVPGLDVMPKAPQAPAPKMLIDPKSIPAEMTAGTGYTAEQLASDPEVVRSLNKQNADYTSFMQRWALPKFSQPTNQISQAEFDRGDEINPMFPPSKDPRRTAPPEPTQEDINAARMNPELAYAGISDDQLSDLAKGTAQQKGAMRDLYAAVGDAVVGLTSPENIATMLTAEFGGMELKAAANSPKVVKFISQLPNADKIMKAVDIAANSAVAAVFGAQATIQSVAAAKAHQTVDAVVNGLIAAASLLGIRETAKGTVEAYPTPEEKTAPTGGAKAAETAKGYAKAGENLKAAEWAKAVKVDVDYQGTPSYVRFTGVKNGEPSFELVNKKTGEVHAEGTYQDIQNALHKPKTPPTGLGPGTEEPPAATAPETPPAPGAPSAPAPSGSFAVGDVFETPSGKFTVKSNEGGKVQFEKEGVGGQVTKGKVPTVIFGKMVAKAAPPAEAAPEPTVTAHAPEDLSPEAPEQAIGQEAAPEPTPAVSPTPQEEPQAPSPAADAAPAEAPTAGKETRPYEDVQKDIDAEEDRLEKQGVDSSKLYLPDNAKFLKDAPGWKSMPQKLADLYAERDAIQTHDDKELDAGIHERLQDLIPDDAAREKLVKKITETDKPFAIRRGGPFDREKWKDIGRLANEVLTFAREESPDDGSFASLKPILGGTAEKPKLGLQLHELPLGYRYPSTAVFDRAQKLLDAIVPGVGIKIPRTSSSTGQPQPQVPGVHSVTGTANPPLTAEGKKEAEQVAEKVTAPNVEVFAAPNDRAISTGEAISPDVKPEESLKPWGHGKEEGQPTEKAQAEIEKRIDNPDEDPGVSPVSGKQGDTFNEFRERFLGGFSEKLATRDPNATDILTVSGSNLQMARAWLAAGMPKDLSVDEEKVKKAYDDKPGAMFRVDTENQKLVPVDKIDAPGTYFVHHAETSFNPAEPTPLASAEKSPTIEAANEPNAPARENPEPLGQVPSEDVSGTQAERELGAKPEERGQVDERGDRGSRGAGSTPEPSEGSDQRAVGVPASGERGADAGTRAVATTPTGSDYRITPEDHIGEGTIRQKANDNLEAIRTLKRIESEGRPATLEEQKILVKYVGWGGMPQPFMEYGVPREWQGVRAELNSTLTPEEFASARASTPNAHYTSPMVIDGVWSALKRIGASPENGARLDILEPSVGVGHFFGLQPGDISRVQRTGIELDSTTGRIAKLLYPESDIHVAGFEAVRLPNDYFDVAVSNVPFGNYGVYDPQFKKTPALTKSIHDYFFAKALEKVRPGGTVAFITSNFTMDKRDPYIRKYLSSKADLIGAIRLPNTAFKGNAGTEVTTDIIILRKRPTGMPVAGEPWADTKSIDTPDGPVEVNEYFANHPEMMVGEMGLQGSMYRDQSAALTGELTPENLAEAVSKLPENVIQPWTAPERTFESLSSIPNAGDIKEGAFAIKDGQIVVRHGDQLRPADLSAKQVAIVKGLIGVRDATRRVFQTQIKDASEAEILDARKELNKLYDQFTRVNGALHLRTNVKAFAEDPDAPLLLSLEDWDPETKKAKKTAIFNERTIDKYKPAESANNATDALSISLNEKGRIDWARMQELTGRTPDELQSELGNLVFQNPEGKGWEPADEYLSGEVRQKLAIAENAARADKKFARNAEALKEIQPKDLMPEEINARLGASWIPKEDVRDFVAELLEMPAYTVKVSHSEAVASWTLDMRRKDTVANSKTYGTARMYGNELIEDALNMRNPTIYDTVGSGADRKSVINEKETLAAREVQQIIKDKFAEWVWANPERSKRLADKYNAEYNGLRLREYDGSHLQFPGMAAGLTLRPHQKNAIWRMLQSGNTLLAHVVGAGKTLAMVGGAMEMRRLGLSRKPMIVVPRNKVEDTAEEFVRAYPAANLMVMNPEDFTPDSRQRFMGRIATGNWDSVIVSYESFEKLPVSDDTFNNFLQEQIDELETYIRESKGDKADARLVKELEKSKKRLEAKLRKKSDRESKDNALGFEELGVDSLFVDEADNFKNLFFPTKMTRIAGIPNTESKRAFDMYIKTQHIANKNNGRGIIFATGTPIANTMAEMWTMQRYLQPQYLRDHGLQHFDAWAQTFGEVRPTLEVAPDASGYRMTNRFARFVNIPELVSGFRLMADVQTADMLKLPVPRVKGGGPITVPAKASPEQKAYLQELAQRAKDIKDKKIKDPRIDNMLKVSTDGRKAALDIRLVRPDAPDFPGSKINRAVEEIHKIWKETAAKKLTQLVFLDFSKPGEPGSHKFSVSDDLKSKLLKKGIPPSEVAFIHEGDKNKAAAELLSQKVNDGRVRILIGSTQKMGVGVNIQRLQVHQHHLDAPWRPRDIEQREGRGIRQGNLNEEIGISRYVTEPSFDAKMWDTLKSKAAFIGQVMRGDIGVRSADDISESALSFAEVAAIASGNPAIQEKTIIDTEVRKLDSLRARHQQQQWSMKRDLQEIPSQVANAKNMASRAGQDIATRDANPAEYIIGKEKFTGEDARKKAGEALQAVLESLRGSRRIAIGLEGSEPQPIGMYRGLRLEAYYNLLDLPKTEGDQAPLPEIRVVGKLTYKASTNQYGDPAGTLQSIESRVRNIEGIRDAQTDDAKRYEKKLKDTEELAKKPFEQDSKLKELLARQSELAKQLQPKEADPQAMTEDVAPTEDGEEGEPTEGVQEMETVDSDIPTAVKEPSESGTGSIEEYKSGREKIKPAAGKDGYFHGEIGGKPYYSDGHFLIQGEAPVKATGQQPNFTGFIESKAELKPVQPAAFSPGAEPKLGKKIKRLLWFDDGTAIDSKFYDLFKKNFPNAEYFLGTQPSGTAPAIYAKVDGKTIGVIMPVQADMPSSVRDAIAFRGKKSERGSAPMLTDLAGAILRMFSGEDTPQAPLDPQAPQKDNYDGWAAFASYILPGRALAQIEKASPEAHTALLKVAGAKGRVIAAIQNVIPRIDKTLEGSDIDRPTLFTAYQESRLRGIRETWQDSAVAALQASDKDLEEDFDAHAALLHAIENKNGFPQDPAMTAASLLESQEFDALRDFLHETFSQAAGAVSTVMEPDEFDYVKGLIENDPKVSAANRLYKKNIESEVREQHVANMGTLATNLGPLDTYFPLIAAGHDVRSGMSRLLPFKKPNNPFNKMATGISDGGYTVDTPELRKRLLAGFQANSKAEAFQTLYDTGMLRKMGRGEQTPETFMFRGVEYPASTVDVQEPKTIFTRGKTIHVPGVRAIGPTPFVNELRSMFEREKPLPTNIVRTGIRWINMGSLVGPGLAVLDSTNIFGTLVSNTPYLGKDLTAKALSLPLLKRFGAIIETLRNDPTTEDAASDLMEMAKYATLAGEKTASVTWSKKLADQTGADLVRWYNFSPLLYGPKGIDIRGRLTMWRVAKAAWPNATPQELHHYVNRLGNYIPELQGGLERGAKRSGLAPFITRGGTMMMNGLDAMTGRSGMGGADPLKRRLTNRARMMAAGAIGLIALWAIIHEASAGKEPWDDRESKFGYIPMPNSWRNTKIGRALTGNKPGRAYLPLYWLNPIAMRGMRVLGLPAAYDTMVRHGTGWQAAEAASAQALDAAAALAGPAVRAPFVALSGKEPYVTNWRDQGGKLNPQLFPAVDEKAKGWKSIGQRTAAGFLSGNVLVNDLGEASGFIGPVRRDEGNVWLQMSMSAAGFPVPTVSNPQKQQESLARQRK